MICIEPENADRVVFTNDQFCAAVEIITATDESIKLSYDFVDETTHTPTGRHTRLFLWQWPKDRTGTPVRHWIREDGEVALSENVDWLDDSDWPEWVG